MMRRYEIRVMVPQLGHFICAAEKIGDNCRVCPHEQAKVSHSPGVRRWYSRGGCGPGASGEGWANGMSFTPAGDCCVPTIAPTAAATCANSETCARGIWFSRPQRGHLISVSFMSGGTFILSPHAHTRNA